MISKNFSKKNKSEIEKQQKIANKVVQKKTSTNGGFYYSFFTVILLLCLVQITVSAVLNISKIISYNAKIVKITQTRDAALALNEQIKDNINNFSNISGLEAIARNNLKMSSKDEVMVIINSPKNENEENNQKSKKWDLKNNN